MLFFENLSTIAFWQDALQMSCWSFAIGMGGVKIII
jgi:hypothetical protein